MHQRPKCKTTYKNATNQTVTFMTFNQASFLNMILYKDLKKKVGPEEDSEGKGPCYKA